MNGSMVRGALLLALLLAGATADAQPTAYSPEFQGYDVFPASPVADAKVAPAVGANRTFSVFAIVETTSPPGATYDVHVVRIGSDLGAGPEPPIDLSPEPTGKAGRIGVCGNVDLGVPNVAIRHVDPFPVFDVLKDDGINASVEPLVNLGFGSIYAAMACLQTPNGLHVFAHHDQTGNVQLYAIDGAVATQIDPGRFWFFAPRNVELAVKAVDSTEFRRRIWAFASVTSIQNGTPLTDAYASFVVSDFDPMRIPNGAPNAVAGTGFSQPCRIVSDAPAPPNLRAPLAVHLTGENSALVLHAVATEIRLTRVADLENCSGVVSQVVPFPSSGSVFDYTGLALLGPTESPTLVGTRVVRATLGAGGDYVFDAGIDLPPAGSGGPRDAIDVGRAQPVVVGAAGVTGLRIMGDATTIFTDSFEG